MMYGALDKVQLLNHIAQNILIIQHKTRRITKRSILASSNPGILLLTSLQVLAQRQQLQKSLAEDGLHVILANMQFIQCKNVF